MEWLASPEAWVALVTLTALEIVLGIDNIIFISILVGRLEPHRRKPAWIMGLSLAMISRIALLFALVWVMSLTKPFITILGEAISGRDLILILGGLFLLAKSTLEIHHSFEQASEPTKTMVVAGFVTTLVQIALLDIVFSLDSVITAVGMVEQVEVMITAIVIAVIVMMLSSGSISRFVETHPTIKMLALSFLVLIGVALIADGLDLHIPKGYIYFAMAFSVAVEMLNLRLRSRQKQSAEETSS